jgi:hypothetical protein
MLPAFFAPVLPAVLSVHALGKQILGENSGLGMTP